MQNQLKNKLEFQRSLFTIIHYHTNTIQFKHASQTNEYSRSSNKLWQQLWCNRNSIRKSICCFYKLSPNLPIYKRV